MYVCSKMIFGVPLTQAAYEYLEDDYSKYFVSLYSGCHDIPPAYIGIVISEFDSIDTYMSVDKIFKKFTISQNDLSEIVDKINKLPIGTSKLLEPIGFYIINYTS